MTGGGGAGEQHAAASARAESPLLNCARETIREFGARELLPTAGLCDLHLQFQTSAHGHGLSSASTCDLPGPKSVGDITVFGVFIASFRPLGSAGTVGMKRFPFFDSDGTDEEEDALPDLSTSHVHLA